MQWNLTGPAWLQVQSRRERVEQGVRLQMGMPVACWGVREVCDWAEHIGLGQYRKRFLHHCIGGALLLELTEHNLTVGPSHLCDSSQCPTCAPLAGNLHLCKPQSPDHLRYHVSACL